MTWIERGMYASLAVFLTLVAARVQARERRLQRSELPPAVAATIDCETRGATVKGYATDTKHGQKVYEAETVISGHTRDIQIAQDGTLTEVEEEVAMDSLPDTVKTALFRRSMGAKINRVESLTKGGKLVAYEATMLKGGKQSELQVGPDGEKLTHSE